MNNVVFSFLGTQLDNAGSEIDRWQKWRPNLSLVMREDFITHRLVLFVQGKRFSDLLRRVKSDIELTSPETEVIIAPLDYRDPWDFQSVYEALLDYTRLYQFDPSREHYLVNMTTGTHVAQICLFLLTEANYFPASLLQSSPARGRQSPYLGNILEIDLDLSKYDGLATRFENEK